MAAEAQQVSTVSKSGEEAAGENKATRVTFPRRNLSVSPIKSEVEESDESMDQPRNMWQVYALGGFMILRWAWAKWMKKKDEGRSAEDDDEDD